MASQTSESDDDAPSRSWYAVIIGGAIICSAVIAFFVRGGMSDIQRLREKKQYLEQRNELLQKQARRLELRRRRLHQDPHLIEDLARDRLGLVRPGEREVQFRESEPDTTTADTNTVDTGSTVDTSFTRPILEDTADRQ